MHFKMHAIPVPLHYFPHLGQIDSWHSKTTSLSYVSPIQVNWYDFLLVTKEAQYYILDLPFQTYLYLMFHQSAVNSASHWINMSLIVLGQIVLLTTVPLASFGPFFDNAGQFSVSLCVPSCTTI